MVDSFLQIRTTILPITGILLAITGWLDAYKYHLSARKIRKVGTARGHSRKFINFALTNDLVRIVHCLLLPEWYLVFSSFVALFFMLEHWLVVYWFYPYRMRGCINFKRPNIMLYLINSLLPNSIRKRL